MNLRRYVVAAVATLLLGGCGGAGREAPRGQAPASEARAPVTMSTPAAAAVSFPDVCAAAPDAEVAQALGAKVKTPAHGSRDGLGSACDYDLDFGDGHAALFFVWAGKPMAYASRELASDQAESVPGMGKDAWIEHAMPEDSWDLHVLLDDALGLEVKGDGKDRVLALGKYLLTQLH
jgi:hypothetical protein